MDLSWLKTLAPTVASALGGPLAGLAVTAIGGALGWDDDKVKDMIQTGKLNAEQLSAVRVAEAELKQREAEMGFKFAELEMQDRQNARERESKVGGLTTPVLAWTVVGAFIAMVGGILFGGAVADSVLAGTLIGYLSAKAEQVMAYYFGSTAGSAAKTALLAKAESIK